MIKRFGRCVTDRIVKAMDRKLQGKETVLQYFNDMMSLLAESEATEKIQLALLTRNMPESYRIQIAGHNPKTTEDWIELALAIEEAKSHRSIRPFETTLYANI